VFCSQQATADEAGVSVWLPGLAASLAAVPPDPGFWLPVNLYGYSGSAGQNKSFPIGRNITTNVSASPFLQMVSPTYIPEAEILGGRLALTITGLTGYQSVTGTVAAPVGVSAQRTDTIFNVGDLFPQVSLYWNAGVHNFKVYAMGDIPVGSYNPDRLANLGLGHGAIDAGGAYTYFDAQNGHELSITAGLTTNFMNTSTSYKNGLDFHLDWGASQFLSKNIMVGLAGFWYHQLTADSGPGAVLGSFESTAVAVGPQIGYMFEANDRTIYANLRGYKEFATVHRLDGFSIILAVAIPLSPSKQ
jgi:hypothetical protein